jgi:hypothetical protein
MRAKRGALPLLLAAAAAAVILAAISPPVTGAAAAAAPETTAYKPVVVLLARRLAITMMPPRQLPNGVSAASSAARGDDGGGVQPAPWHRPPPAANSTRVPPLNLAPAAAEALGSSGGDKTTPSFPAVARAWRSFNAYDGSVAVGNPNGRTGDPPDMGLAVGAGFVMQSVNGGLRVYDQKSGRPLTPPVDHGALYGLPLPSNPGCRDLFTNPTTLFDPDTRRWFQTILHVQLDADCKRTGRFSLDVAVSATSSPVGRWYSYSIAATGDGQQGSPVLPGCEAAGCLPDYPQTALDAHALVITTNQFATAADEDVVKGVATWVLDKGALVRGAARAGVAVFATRTAGAWDNDGEDGVGLLYNLIPSNPAPQGKQEHSKKGADPAPLLLLARSFASPSRLLRGALTGTRALALASTPARLDALKAALTLTISSVEMPGAVPYASRFLPAQPSAGNYPYGQSVGATEPGNLGAPRTGMMSSAVSAAAGRQFGVFVTEAQASGDPQTRYVIYLVQLDARTGAFLRGDLLGQPGEHSMVPAVAVDRRGQGGVVCMAFGEGRYPSIAFYPIRGADGSVGARQIPLEGLGLQDTFTQYIDGGVRPRIGDYAAAAIDDRTGLLYASVEYISRMSCSLADWEADPTCGGTRAKRANWDTGIVAMKV